MILVKKYIPRIMLLIVIAIVIFDATVWMQYQYHWNKLQNEAGKAKAAGYEKEYSICSRENSVTLDGIEFDCFHAFRSMPLDGNYNEMLLVEKSHLYMDKVPREKEGLVIFAKPVSYYEDNHGASYTILDIYSVCKYSMKASEHWVRIAFLATITGGMSEILLLLVLAVAVMRPVRKW